MSYMITILLRRIPRFQFLALATLALGRFTALGAVPPAEKLLPPDTLLVVSAPDWTQLREVYKKSPQSQFWEDPAMKPFREKFLNKWNEEFVKPLERDLGVKLDDYGALLQGQVTLAVTQEGWQGKEKDDGDPAILFLLDAKDKADLLKKNLADLRKKWSEAGKPMKTEKIRDIEFSIVPLTTNDVPKTLKQFFPQHQQVEELGKEDQKSSATDELVIGQYDSLLIIGTTVKAVEKIVIRLTGNTAPTLSEQADFGTSRQALFRDAPLFGWFNARTCLDVLVRTLSSKDNSEAPSPLTIPPVAKLVAASGLIGVKTVAFDFRDTGEGRLFEFFLAAPESGRAGLTRLLTLTPKDSSAPVFVPADVVKFQRSRIDGPKAIAIIEKMLSDISAEALNTWNFLLSNGNEAMRVNDPNYDIRKNLFGNLGDDFIAYEKLARGDSALEKASPPSLVLIGSPNPDQLAAALKGLFIFLPEGGNLQTREFLGKKIFTVKLTALPMAGTQTVGRTLSYAASAGYVAFSTDAGILEEFLRSGESQSKPLRDLPGLADAMGRIGGQSTGWFTYENESETMRILFEVLRRSAGDTNSTGPSVLGSAIPFASPEKKFRDWLDFSLLPDYEKVSRYFGFGVQAGSANVDGLTFRMFSPTPPQLKK
ncbi:MAG: hypothetical protein U1F83_19030 [Verrucomicrobiota bacterium]